MPPLSWDLSPFPCEEGSEAVPSPTVRGAHPETALHSQVSTATPQDEADSDVGEDPDPETTPQKANEDTGLPQVQIEGSVVYSNYCVGLEVQAQAPVSVISEGTHLFFSRTASSPIVLRGTQSFDPDNPGASLRFLQISWVSFKDTFVNRNDELSLQAVCEDCGEMSNLSYSWDLFLVNATDNNRIEVPFCRVVGLLGSLGLGAVSISSQSSLLSTEPGTADPDATTTPFSREASPMTLSQPAPSAPRGTPTELMTGVYWIPAVGDSAVPGKAPEEGLLDPEPGPQSKGSLMTDPSERSQPTHSPDPHLSAGQREEHAPIKTLHG
ncbi:polycystin-1-like protein 1 [Aotus nancymaae]|uniref:polycystin-1-like protein 1 n=1 Tax=Aotus nancymaae TaxID=37293 RepID=UPI0030FEAF9F